LCDKIFIIDCFMCKKQCSHSILTDSQPNSERCYIKNQHHSLGGCLDLLGICVHVRWTRFHLLHKQCNWSFSNLQRKRFHKLIICNFVHFMIWWISQKSLCVVHCGIKSPHNAWQILNGCLEYIWLGDVKHVVISAHACLLFVNMEKGLFYPYCTTRTCTYSIFAIREKVNAHEQILSAVNN